MSTGAIIGLGITCFVVGTIVGALLMALLAANGDEK